MDWDRLRQQLLDERRRLASEVAQLDADLGESLGEASGESPYGQHLAETAAVTIDREIDLSLEGNARSAMIRVDRALRKLDDGSYGLCDRCGNPIGDERLEAVPVASLCIGCKRIEERR